jgi:DNA-directed RNA polymerase subunit RPC12/RpoP
MGDVVRLFERRPGTPVLRPRADPRSGLEYYCERCESEEFRLYTAGTVHCARCGARMANLQVLKGS